jgi:hypothetical protein
MATATRRRGARKAAPAPVVEEIEDDAIEDLEDEDVEELELDEPEELEEEPPKRRTRATKATKATATKAAPAKATRKAKAPVETEDEDEDAGPVYDTNWLAEYVNETVGTDYDSRSLRMLLRKLAHDGTISREVGTDRSRYTFPRGAADPIVKAVLKAIRTGATEEETPAPAKKAPAKKAAAKAAPAPAKATKTTRRRRAAVVEEEDDE